jgi:hypothetical protein
MTLINRFERSCSTFRRGGGENPLSSITLNWYAQKKEKKKKNLYLIYFQMTMTMGWMLA